MVVWNGRVPHQRATLMARSQTSRVELTLPKALEGTSWAGWKVRCGSASDFGTRRPDNEYGLLRIRPHAGYADETCFSFTGRSGSVDHAPENSHARSATARSGSWPHHRSSGNRRVRVGARAIILASHLLKSIVRNNGIRRERLLRRYQHNGRLPRIFTGVFNRREKSGIEPRIQAIVTAGVSSLVPLAGNRLIL